MRTSGKTALLLGALAALLWSRHFYVLEGLRGDDVPVLVLQFHLLFWPAAVFLLLLFISGRTSALSVFNRRETRFLALAAAGGYGFWVLRALALESGDAPQVHLLFYTAPLLMGLLSVFTGERADRKVAFGLLLGFIGCIVLVEGQGSGMETAAPVRWSARFLAVGASACWAVFSLMARPIVREEKVLPVVALVTGVGAICLFVTCLSTGESIFRISPPQMLTAALAGLFTVGLMMAAWLKCLGMMPVSLASPLWYLGLLFGLIWAHRSGVSVSGWLALAGAVLILLGLHSALGGRQRSAVTMSDIIRA